MEIATLWDEVVLVLEQRLPETDLRSWVDAIRARELRGDRFVADVPSRMHLDEVRRRAGSEIVRALGECLGRAVSLELDVRSAPARPSAPRRRPTPFSAAYTFERFVTGKSNEVAYHSARKVAEQPGRLFNPLFLCGGVGLGKTHLATAIANAVSESGPRRRVVVLSAESFTNELIQALRSNGTASFRTKFRRADVLVVDDVQFLAGKERMQEEFFHTFNALYAEGHQIVLASDQPPQRIPDLEERLRSRFESGLITDIHRPDLALRLAVVAEKARWLGLDLPREVVGLVADRIVSSIRELEGALHRLAAASRLGERRLDLALATQILRPLFRAPAPKTVEQVQRLVAEQFHVTERDLVCHRRSTKVVVPRQVAMYLARKGTQATYAEIAEGFGGRNHTTVLHAVRTVEQRRAVEPEFAAMLESLETRLADSA